MACKDMIIGLVKHTIALGSSSFDMGSDFVNALNFLGYFHSHLENETLSTVNSPYFISNNTNITSGMNNALTNKKNEAKVHQTWGIMSMMLIFLPGFVYGFTELIEDILERKWCHAFVNLVLNILFPFIFIFWQLFALIITCKEQVSQYYQAMVTSMTSAEAALESTGQLLLQLFTLINGYPSSTIQRITICTSFFQIGRSVILQDIETKLIIRRRKIEKENALTFCESLNETLKRIPVYVPNIIFRTGSLVVAMAYLRLFSIIPICILLLELGWMSWIRFRKLSDKKKIIKYVLQLAISNVGVMNSYAFDQGSDEGNSVEEDGDDIKKFIVRSALVTCFHHITTLVIIMVIGYVQPEFFVATLIITPTKGGFYTLMGTLIGMGGLCIIVTLFYVHWTELPNCCCRRSAPVDQDNRDIVELDENNPLDTENA